MIAASGCSVATASSRSVNIGSAGPAERREPVHRGLVEVDDAGEHHVLMVGRP